MTEDMVEIQVPAPDKWMQGWDNYYKKQLEKKENLKELIGISPPVQVLAGPLYATIKEEKSALDLACGDGRTTCFLAKLNCNVQAIDALPSAIELTKTRAEILGFSKKVTTELKDIDGWDMGKEQYDIIIATQCIQYIFDRAIPRLKEIAEAIKPGGFVVYSGNIPPHFETDPPMKFVREEELKEIFEGWTFHSIGNDLRLLRPGDLRGYIWIVAEKPKEEKE